MAGRIRSLVEGAGFASAENPGRGYDHGTFVPLKMAFPAADLPVVQLSMLKSLDPAEHLALVRALAPLRDEGVFIVGSGDTFHNMRGFGPAFLGPSTAFYGWLTDAVEASADERDRRLSAWATAPSARVCHPREDHLLPLLVAAGAAGLDRGTVTWRGTFMGPEQVGFHFG